MSSVDPQFETNVITLLKGIYDNIGTGVPYKSINVSFYQDQSDDSVVYTELSNNSEYTIDVQGISPGVIEVTTDIPDFRNTQVFVSPLTHLTNYCSITMTSGDPYIFTLNSRDPDNGADARGFGNDGLSRVTFEIRIYPEPA